MMVNQTQLMIPSGNKNLLLANRDLFSDYHGISLVDKVQSDNATFRLCFLSWVFRPFTFSFKTVGSSGNGVPASGVGDWPGTSTTGVPALVVLGSTAVELASDASSGPCFGFPRCLPAMDGRKNLACS